MSFGLPERDGVRPARLRLPPGDWPTVLAYLLARFPWDAARLQEKVAAGEVVDAAGNPIMAETPYLAGGFAVLYRDLPVEVGVPFTLRVLHRDDDLLVVDKPHFLATAPRGSHVRETALVRLRREFALPDLSPAHRLDRLTAGVLIFTVRTEMRRPYQTLFASRRLHKRYEAIAGHLPDLTLPQTRRSRIVKERGMLQAREVPGEPNAQTLVEVAEVRGGFARYRLTPTTGKTHQLRVHLNALGIPIAGDPLYPTVRGAAPDDFTDPLRLLARSVEFTDPRTGAVRRFESTRSLDWPAT